MKQYSFKEVQGMTFAELGAIDDPMQLMSAQFVSPMLVRYAVRTGQLEQRFGYVPLGTLLDALNFAATKIPLPVGVTQKAPLAARDPEVDGYLDALAPHMKIPLSKLSAP